MKKWRLILVLVLIAIFVTVIAISRIKNVDKTLKIESEIDLNIVKDKSYKGFTTMNDSIVISDLSPRINIKEKGNFIYKVFGSLDAPFKITKHVNSDTLIVIKDSQKLFYKLIN